MADFLHLVGGVRRDAAGSDHGVRSSYALPALDGAPRAFFVGPYSFLQYQLSAGSCVAHGTILCVESDVRGEQGADWQICRLDVYRGARLYRGWENEDSGCLASDAVRWIEEEGLASESHWPYDPTKVVNVPPPPLVVATRPFSKGKWTRLYPDPEQIMSHMWHRKKMVNMTFAVGGAYTRTRMPGGVMEPFDVVDGWHDEAWVGWDLDHPAGPVLWKAGSWEGHGVDHPAAETDARFAHLRGRRGFTAVRFPMLSDPSRFGEVHGLVQSPNVEA